jgi:hypothetical protein
MSSQDKTGDKLVASIRKTKAGASAQSADAGAVAASEKTPPASKAVPKKKVVRKKAAAAPKKSTSAKPTYQSAGRVWPD